MILSNRRIASFGRERQRLMSHSLAPDISGLDDEMCQLACPDLREGGEKTYVRVSPPLNEDRSIVGFDLRVGGLIGVCDVVMDNVTIGDVRNMQHKELKPGEEYVLQPDEDGGRVYYVVGNEIIDHSDDLEVLVDSKSTTGRVGAICHGAGFNHSVAITAIQPLAFPLLVRSGKSKLAQVVFRYAGSDYIGNGELSKLIGFEGDGVDLNKDSTSRGLQMRFDTERVYRARKGVKFKPIDMDLRGELNWRDYFELIEGNGEFTVDGRRLYLTGSLGILGMGGVVGVITRESEVLTGTGAWSHLAGVVQPYWRGGITMEVYIPGGAKRRIKKGDRAGVIIFDKIDGAEGSYDGDYMNQRPPMLPKMFKQD